MNNPYPALSKLSIQFGFLDVQQGKKILESCKLVIALILWSIFILIIVNRLPKTLLSRLTPLYKLLIEMDYELKDRGISLYFLLLREGRGKGN